MTSETNDTFTVLRELLNGNKDNKWEIVFAKISRMTPKDQLVAMQYAIGYMVKNKDYMSKFLGLEGADVDISFVDFFRVASSTPDFFKANVKEVEKKL